MYYFAHDCNWNCLYDWNVECTFPFPNFQLVSITNLKENVHPIWIIQREIATLIWREKKVRWRGGRRTFWALPVPRGKTLTDRTHPLRTPRMRFMTKKAPRTTMETKYPNCHVLPMESWTWRPNIARIITQWSGGTHKLKHCFLGSSYLVHM